MTTAGEAAGETAGETGMRRVVRIATRASALAMWQAEHVAGLLRAHCGAEVEIVQISTSGDQNQTAALSSFGGFGVFTREVQKGVLDRRADLAVHSLKDLPTEPTPGLTLGCVPAREATADALVLPIGRLAAGLDSLPPGARIGTGSLRRQAQLRHLRPDLALSEIRGNVDTRLRKLDQGEYDAIVLAAAGLKRLGWAGRISLRLEPPVMLAAVGQGALGLECRADDADLLGRLACLEDPAARARVTAERALLAALRAGCHAPVGVHTAVLESEKEPKLALEAVVLSADGKQRLHVAEAGPLAAADAVGRRAAERLLAAGANSLIRPDLAPEPPAST